MSAPRSARSSRHGVCRDDPNKFLKNKYFRSEYFVAFFLPPRFLLSSDFFLSKIYSAHFIRLICFVVIYHPPHDPFPIRWSLCAQEPRPTALEEVYRDIDKKTPVIFILSVGADPSQILFRFATEMKYRERLRIISLGQGMGPKAARMIEARRQMSQLISLKMPVDVFNHSVDFHPRNQKAILGSRVIFTVGNGSLHHSIFTLDHSPSLSPHRRPARRATGCWCRTATSASRGSTSSKRRLTSFRHESKQNLHNRFSDFLPDFFFQRFFQTISWCWITFHSRRAFFSSESLVQMFFLPKSAFHLLKNIFVAGRRARREPARELSAVADVDASRLLSGAGAAERRQTDQRGTPRAGRQIFFRFFRYFFCKVFVDFV